MSEDDVLRGRFGDQEIVLRRVPRRGVEMVCPLIDRCLSSALDSRVTRLICQTEHYLNCEAYQLATFIDRSYGAGSQGDVEPEARVDIWG